MSISHKMMMAAAGAGGGGVEPLPISDTFSTDLYTGNGSTQTITNGIDLSGEGGLVWIKGRSAVSNNMIFDTNRGIQERLISSSTGGSALFAPSLEAFNSDGFSVGNQYDVNSSGMSIVSWTFRKAPAFFDVVTYTGNGLNDRSIPHNLGVEPGMIIIKRIDGIRDWYVYHRSTGIGSYLILNQTATAQSNTNFWRSHTQDTFDVKVNVNDNGFVYVAYLFAHDETPEGTIRCGTVTTGGDGAIGSVSLGWEPQWLLIKSRTVGQSWYLFDTARGFSQSSLRALFPNSSGAELNFGASSYLYTTPDGFEGTTSFFGGNNPLIYIAIRAEGA